MRERQQMASRPFASVAVALDARGEQTELLQPVVDVSTASLFAHTNFKFIKFLPKLQWNYTCIPVASFIFNFGYCNFLSPLNFFS